MSLTNRILLAMVLGIGLGSVLEVVLASLTPDSGLYGFLYNGMVMAFLMFWGVFLSPRSNYWWCHWCSCP